MNIFKDFLKNHCLIQRKLYVYLLLKSVAKNDILLACPDWKLANTCQEKDDTYLGFDGHKHFRIFVYLFCML